MCRHEIQVTMGYNCNKTILFPCNNNNKLNGLTKSCNLEIL
jgi:hypothetical protein